METTVEGIPVNQEVMNFPSQDMAKNFPLKFHP